MTTHTHTHEGRAGGVTNIPNATTGSATRPSERQLRARRSHRANADRPTTRRPTLRSRTHDDDKAAEYQETPLEATTATRAQPAQTMPREAQHTTRRSHKAPPTTGCRATRKATSSSLMRKPTSAPHRPRRPNDDITPTRTTKGSTTTPTTNDAFDRTKMQQMLKGQTNTLRSDIDGLRQEAKAAIGALKSKMTDEFKRGGDTKRCPELEDHRRPSSGRICNGRIEGRTALDRGRSHYRRLGHRHEQRIPTRPSPGMARHHADPRPPRPANT